MRTSTLSFALSGPPLLAALGLLISDAAPVGSTRLSGGLADNADGLGRRYVSELRRNFRQ